MEKTEKEFLNTIGKYPPEIINVIISIDNLRLIYIK
jgi:hypothetical protein